MGALKAGRLLLCWQVACSRVPTWTASIPVSKDDPRCIVVSDSRFPGFASAIVCLTAQPCTTDMIPDRVSVEKRVQLEEEMKRTILNTIFEFSRLAVLSLVLAVNASAFAQKQAAKGAERL